MEGGDRMKRVCLILLKAVGFVLLAAVYLWFWPLMLQMVMDGSWDRYELQKRNNEYWFRRHGFDQWFRHFQREQHKRRKKKWKKRNDFYK